MKGFFGRLALLAVVVFFWANFPPEDFGAGIVSMFLLWALFLPMIRDGWESSKDKKGYPHDWEDIRSKVLSRDGSIYLNWGGSG